MAIGDRGDVLINRTADGVPLDQVWLEAQAAVDLYNQVKDAITGLWTYKTTLPADSVPQAVAPELMERASALGVPRAIRPDLPYLKVGFTRHDHDIASRLSWEFLRDASAEQVTAQLIRLINADRYTVQTKVMTRAFSPVEEANEWQHRCFGAYVGTDGIKPPDYLGRTFDATHSHYIPTGSVNLDSEDVELLVSHVREHGYGRGGNSGRIVLMFHPDDVEDSSLTSWRAGVENSNSKKARHDFIVSSNEVNAPYLTSESVVGEKPPATYEGLPVIGSYGSALVVSSEVVPAGYFAAVATHGINSDGNAIALREHERADYQGFRLLEGNASRSYPIVESFGMRTFGVGARRRGMWAVAQLTASSSYTAPTSFAI